MRKNVLADAWRRYKENPEKRLEDVAKKVCRGSDIKTEQIVDYLKSKISRRKLWKRFALLGMLTAAILVPVLNNYINRKGNPAHIDDRIEEARREIIRNRPNIRPSINDLAKLEGVKEIIKHKGKYPDIIFIPFFHVQHYSLSSNYAQNIDSAIKVHKQLYEKFGVRAALIEGISSDAAHFYTINEQFLEIDKTNKHVMAHFEFYSKFPKFFAEKNKKWIIYPDVVNREKDIRLSPIKEVSREFKLKLEDEIEKVKKEINSKGSLSKEDKASYEYRLIKAGDSLYKKAENKINSLLTDRRFDELYQLTVIEKEDLVVSQIKGCIRNRYAPIEVLYGTSHIPYLEARLSDFSIATLLTEGSDKYLPEYLSEEKRKKDFRKSLMPLWPLEINLEFGP